MNKVITGLLKGSAIDTIMFFGSVHLKIRLYKRKGEGSGEEEGKKKIKATHNPKTSPVINGQNVAAPIKRTVRLK